MTRLEREDIWRHLDGLTKPQRSLGRLEQLAMRLCEIQQTLMPVTMPRRLVLFAGDHGVVDEGVTMWPSQVTAMMVENIRRGGAASAALASATGTPVTLVNVGVAGELRNESSTNGSRLLDPNVDYVDETIRRGTRNMKLEPAMTVDELDRALAVGWRHAQLAASQGARVVAAGEMGIGNTTSAACLAMLLADVPLDQAVGRGAGADYATLQRKCRIVKFAFKQAAIELYLNARTAIAAVAGFEIAAMAGFFLEAHEQGLTIVLDGYVASVAALVAEWIEPGAAASMIAAHLSEEPGHAAVLEALGLEPFLDWQLRLGEGTGALLLFPMLDAAAAMSGRMASFADLGIDMDASET